MTERNGDSSEMNGQRNGPMTNAERQRRYRDRKRGGPPIGRWPSGAALASIADNLALRRTFFFMARWISDHAPEYHQQIWDGKVKISPLYRRLKDEYDRAAFIAVCDAREAGRDPYDLVVRRVDGQFVVTFGE